jgi:leucyl aminopeptidase
VQIELAGPCGSAKVDAEAAGSAFGEGLGLIGWVCDQFKGKATSAPTRAALKIDSSSRGFRDGLERGLALAASANFTRTLSETPPNIATPAYMADQAQKMARKVGLKCTVYKGDAWNANASRASSTSARPAKTSPA